MNPPQVSRVLRWFEKGSGEAFVGEETLSEIRLIDLQREFRVESTNPMCDCWKVEEQHVGFVQNHCRTIIVLGEFDYFVEADAI